MSPWSWRMEPVTLRFVGLDFSGVFEEVADQVKQLLARTVTLYSVGIADSGSDMDAA